VEGGKHMAILNQQFLADYRQRISQAAAKIQSFYPDVPSVLIVLGSGLGALADKVCDPKMLSYHDIPGFPEATVTGHAGRMVFGKWDTETVAVMQGRFHAYEGHPPEDIVLPIRVMQKLGVPYLLMTNAAGGLDQRMKAGDLMLIRDHIGLLADSPLRGMNLDEYGPRFPDQTHVYNRHLAELAIRCAHQMGLKLHEGVYAYSRGPQFETPAEIRMLKTMGASAVGMSTVPEAIAAAHGGMRTLAISCITNLGAGILDKPLSHEEVLEVGQRVAGTVTDLLTRILDSISEERKT
jgi:purine-nucleoside phosphorylase